MGVAVRLEGPTSADRGTGMRPGLRPWLAGLPSSLQLALLKGSLAYSSSDAISCKVHGDRQKRDVSALFGTRQAFAHK